MTKKTEAKKLLSRAMAALLVFSTCQQGMIMSAFADNSLTLTPRIDDHVSVSVDGGQVSITDTDDNNDVWNSKVLLEANKELVPGKEYKISFDLEGDHGVGELFLCKSANMDDRYDDTFTSEAGSRSLTFTAVGQKLYIGMQVGNVGNGNTVKAVVNDIVEREGSENAALLLTANCDAKVENGVITATDTSDNNDVWNSKLLYEVEEKMEIGKTYEIQLDASGDNGVGEMFLCRSTDLNDRYPATFTNAAGSTSFHFTAVSEKLYVGMQIGNVGKGNTVKVAVGSLKPYSTPEPISRVKYNVTEEDGIITVVATDICIQSTPWDSQVLVPIDGLTPGVEYEITFDVTGDNGVGEVFLNTNASLDWDKHYLRSDTPNNEGWEVFVNKEDHITMRFVAQHEVAYLGMQLGNVGEGNSVTVQVTRPIPYEPGVKSTDGCNYEVTSNENNIVKITAVDDNADKDVWTSKLVHFLGNLLEAGKNYVARIATTGIGQFFLKKDDNMYTTSDDVVYVRVERNGDEVPTQDVQFTATSDQLYALLQFGAAGTGNTFEVEVQDLIKVPFIQVNNNGADRFHVVDANDNSIVFSNKWKEADAYATQALYDTGIELKAGETYTLHFSLDGIKDGGAEFFIPGNLEDPYNWQTRLKQVDGNDGIRDCFSNSNGDDQTFTFVATEDTHLYFAVQIGGLAADEHFTVGNVSVEHVAPAPVAAAAFSAEEPVAEAAEAGETEAEVTEPVTTEGEATEGAAAEGAATEGAAAEGAATEGAATEGAVTEGAATEGAATEGSTEEVGNTEE